MPLHALELSEYVKIKNLYLSKGLPVANQLKTPKLTMMLLCLFQGEPGMSEVAGVSHKFSCFQSLKLCSPLRRVSVMCYHFSGPGCSKQY